MTKAEQINFIQTSIDSGTPIVFDYTDAVGNQTTNRVVDVDSMYIKKGDGVWINGQCRTHSGHRQFRLERMANLRQHVETFRSVGQQFVHKGDNRIYILVAPSYQTAVLIDVADGLRWNETAAVQDVHKISAKEWEEICCGDVNDFDEVNVKIDLVPAERYFKAINHNYTSCHVIVTSDGKVHRTERNGLRFDSHYKTLAELLNQYPTGTFLEVGSEAELYK